MCFYIVRLITSGDFHLNFTLSSSTDPHRSDLEEEREINHHGEPRPVATSISDDESGVVNSFDKVWISISFFSQFFF